MVLTTFLSQVCTMTVCIHTNTQNMCKQTHGSFVRFDVEMKAQPKRAEPSDGSSICRKRIDVMKCTS